ncbi:MAG: hypothetical protein MUC87_14300 [Bacteroidia bacterium]|jgi:hypothetical protein|nr:hypothetical protein [Bacteroidia bacterium]
MESPQGAESLTNHKTTEDLQWKTGAERYFKAPTGSLLLYLFFILIFIPQNGLTNFSYPAGYREYFFGPEQEQP